MTKSYFAKYLNKCFVLLLSKIHRKLCQLKCTKLVSKSSFWHPTKSHKMEFFSRFLSYSSSIKEAKRIGGSLAFIHIFLLTLLCYELDGKHSVWKSLKKLIFTNSRCLKITEKVSFKIASEASYVYILSGQKLIKNAKNGPFWRVFENLKLTVKQCYQTGNF